MSVILTDKNYYPQVFLGKYKYVAQEKKMPKLIIDDIEISSHEENSYDLDEEYSDENILAEKARCINLFLEAIH